MEAIEIEMAVIGTEMLIETGTRTATEIATRTQMQSCAYSSEKHFVH
jgi:hypothetical protein